MNKTISINLGGELFNIEEDGYEKLKKYLDDIKNHFAALGDQGEVVGDIEARIAEQLAERNNKERKTVVTLSDIDALILTMGTVEDITGEHTDNTHSRSTNNTDAHERRLYRDEDNAIIAGVCSGIAAYLDTDPVWVRLIFFASIFFGGSGILIYIILWIAMPPARTATEKMEMRGKKITLAGVQETIKAASETVGGEAKNIFGRLTQFIRAALQRIFFVFGKVVKKLGRIVAFLAGIFIVLGSIAVMICTFVGGTMAALPWGNYYIDFSAHAAIHNGLYWGIIITAISTIVIPLIFLLLLGITLVRRRSTFGTVSSIALLGMWVASVTALAVMIMSAVPAYDKYIEQVRTLPAITREYTDKFENVNIRNAEKVTVVYGPEYKVTARSAEMSLDRMNITATDGNLDIFRKNSNRFCIDCEIARLPVEVFITAPSLKDIRISGADKVVIDGFKDEQFNAHIYNGGEATINVTGKEMKLDIQDINTVTVSGTTAIFDVNLEGYSHEVLHAFDLKTSTTTINMSHSNMLAEISASQALNVISRGEGKVIYKGTPKITEEFSKETLEDLHFQYEGNEYPVVMEKIKTESGMAYKIKIDRADDDDIPDNKIVNLKINNKDYTARVQVTDDYDKTQLYNIAETEVAPPSIVEAAK